VIDHATLKLIHVSCAILSIIGFSIRGGLMLADSSLLDHKLVKKTPHYVDASLLFSGIWLAINLQQYPGTTPWLTAKLVALVIYVLLGSLALRGKTGGIRHLTFVGALVVVAYIASVALTRSATPWDPL
jgi:uncharacterized membrane protein SirB2